MSHSAGLMSTLNELTQAMSGQGDLAMSSTAAHLACPVRVERSMLGLWQSSNLQGAAMNGRFRETDIDLVGAGELAQLESRVKSRLNGQVRDLRLLVGSRLVRGDLHVHGWVYKMETGQVFAFDAASGQFLPIAEYKYPESETTVRRRTEPAI